MDTIAYQNQIQDLVSHLGYGFSWALVPRTAIGRDCSWLTQVPGWALQRMRMDRQPPNPEARAGPELPGTE